MKFYKKNFKNIAFMKLLEWSMLGLDKLQINSKFLQNSLSGNPANFLVSAQWGCQ